MTDTNEIEALKSSLRGALSTGAALEALRDRVSALDPHNDIDIQDLEELARITLAHAVAAQALRGLVESMRARRRR
jgi:hypothetical protein